MQFPLYADLRKTFLDQIRFTDLGIQQITMQLYHIPRPHAVWPNSCSGQAFWGNQCVGIKPEPLEADETTRQNRMAGGRGVDAGY
jgi:hypothetical protein